MTESVEGIVVSETNYSETSKIINVITKEGTIGLLSKGARTIKSPLRSVSTKFTYATWWIKKKKSGISTLISADPIFSFNHILTDITRISYATYIMELVSQVMNQTKEERVYDLLVLALKKLDSGFDSDIITNIVELQLLDFLGVKPYLNGCAVCGSPTDIVTISSYAGGYLCKNCYHDEPLVSTKTLQLIRMLSMVDLEKVTKIKVSTQVKKELNQFLEDYYDRYTGLYLQSRKLLKNLRLLG